MRAGFLTGGTAAGADAGAEVLRLNAIVDELTSKLTLSQERCQSIEHSIHKGNVSVTAERQQHEQRLAALQAELQGAQERELALGAQLAQLPKRQENELERLRIQAQGAVELQSKYDEAVKKLQALEAEAAFLRQDHTRATAVATSTGEHNQKIMSELTSAQAQLEVAQNRATGLAAEVEQLRAQLDGAASSALGGDDAGTDPATAAATRAVATISELEAFVDQVRDDCAVAVEEAQAAAAAVQDSTSAQSSRLDEMQASLLEAETAAAAAAQQLKLAVARAEVAEANGASAEQMAACACAEVRKEAAEAAAEAARQALVDARDAADKAHKAGKEEGKAEGKAEAARGANANAATAPVAVPVTPPAHASLDELDAALVDAHCADEQRRVLTTQIETVAEAQSPARSRAPPPRRASIDALRACRSTGGLHRRASRISLWPTATKDGKEAAATRQTVEQRARVQKLVAAISQDLKVFVMDSTLKW